jgi:hypothetical protein
MNAEEIEKSSVKNPKIEAECSDGDLEHAQNTQNNYEDTPIEYVQGIRYWAMGFMFGT